MFSFKLPRITGAYLRNTIGLYFQKRKNKPTLYLYIELACCRGLCGFL